MATITYVLSTAGQRASLLAGGDGKALQTIEVDRSDPQFPRILGRASIGPDGGVTLQVSGYTHTFDAPQTAQSILDALDAADRAAEAEKARRIEERRAETRAVLTERRTRKHTDTVGVNRDGSPVAYSHIGATGAHSYETAAWPYEADADVTASPEAVAWEAELATAKAAALEAALAEARAKLPALLAAEAEAARLKAEQAAALTAAKVAMGGLESDYLCRVEDGAVQNVPLRPGDKNWIAVIQVSPTSPGGLAREFAAKARGGAHYMVPSLSIGDAVEFGADEVSRRGKRTVDRWYGFVVAITAEAVLLRPCPTGKAACKEGAKHAARAAKS